MVLRMVGVFQIAGFIYYGVVVDLYWERINKRGCLYIKGYC